MKVHINKSVVSGKINAIGSKSYFQRVLLASFLFNYDNSFTIYNTNNSLSNDINDMINFGKALNFHIITNNDCVNVSRELSKDYLLSNNHLLFNISESATTLRLVIPVLYSMNKEFIINVNESLSKRPLDEYQIIFGNNLRIDNKKITGNGNLDKNEYIVNGNKSSQFASGMLFALALKKYHNPNDVYKLEVKSLASKNYFLMTLDVLKQFGFCFEINKDNNDYCITINKYIDPKINSYNLEGDYTQSFNFFILGLLNSKNLKITNLSENSLQSDYKIYKDICEKFNITNYEFHKVDLNNINDLSFDIINSPDLGPILIILLLFTSGKLTGAHNLVYKESNRINSIEKNLSRINCNIKYINQEIIVEKLDLSKIKYPIVFDSFNDHRIVMALTVLGSILGDVWIENCEGINKSYPSFFEDMKLIGANINIK